MLVLSRKKNESIVINDNITLVVVDIKGDKVRLGINAPKDVPVHRKEIYNAIRAGEKREEYLSARCPNPVSDFPEVAAEIEKTLAPNVR